MVMMTISESYPMNLLFLFSPNFSSSSSSEDNYFLEDSTKLVQCSTVSKRFNALVFLVPTLSITHLNIAVLYKYCPIILKKFKHIRSLQVTHWSCTEKKMTCEDKPLPTIIWEASYKPRSYCLAVVSYQNKHLYSAQNSKFPDPQSLMLSVITAKDHEYYESFRSHTRNMICLYHMLVSLIKDYVHLQRVEVNDLNNKGTLILEENTLAELRNCTSTDLEQVQARYRSGSHINFDVPLIKNCLGFVLDNVCFSIVEWWENTMGDHTYKDDDWVIKSGLLNEWFMRRVLMNLLENPDNVEDNDNRTVLQLLSDLKCGGSLL